jgi:two-component system sensor histidine kinase BaeS
MHIRLFHKLFGAFLLTTVVSLALMIGILHVFNARNFTDYLRKVDLEMLGGLTAELGQVHRREGSWAGLADNPAFWRLIQASRRPELTAPAPPREAADWPPVRWRREGGPPPGGDLLRLGARLSLFDARQRFVAGLGGDPGDYTLLPIEEAGATIGYLGLKPRDRRGHPLAAAFIQAQIRGFGWGGGGVLLLVSIVAFFVSRHLLAPVARLTEGTRALAQRRFDTRIAVSTGDELGQLAGDFNTMAETLGAFEKRQRLWISDIAHELRTPLAVLRGEIEALQDGVRPWTAESLDSLHAEAGRLQRLVQDLHELSLADAGALTFNRVPLDLRRVLTAALGRFAPRLAQGQLAVGIEGSRGPIILQGDSDRLGQLFGNLLENTLRYTDSPGKLAIHLAPDDGGVRLLWDDSAPGVPDEALERLFERLFRVEVSRDRSAGGAGLGLAICRHIVAAHGGTITAAHSPLGGLRIAMRLPLAKAPLPPGDPEP